MKHFCLKMLDMINPAIPGKIALNDLKRCHMTPIFFDTFFNLEKYLDHEQRDPFASQRDPDSENGDEIVKVMSQLYFYTRPFAIFNPFYFFTYYTCGHFSPTGIRLGPLCS